MPKTKHSKGYDGLKQWTRMELRRLYQAEGYSTKEAIRMAQTLYEGIRNLNRAGIYSWNKCREVEMPLGAGRVIHNLTGDYLSTNDLWAEIQIQSRPPKHETHYERLAGRPMRLSEEEKEARRKEAFERLLERATELRARLLGR
jgi:hypothetical protein